LRLIVTLVAWVFAGTALANDGDKISLAEAAQRAIQQSSLTSPDSKPFHLRATIAETGEPGSDYQAKIEEFWVSPSKWRRRIESPNFSQTLIVDADVVYEEDDGDYFPYWLNEFLTALFDPLPMMKALQQSNAQIAEPLSEKSTSCADFRGRVNRWVICFEGNHGLLASVFTKGYGAEFKDYKKFEGKFVPWRIENDPEPGTHLEVHITELSQLTQPYEQLFGIQQPTPASERLSSVRLDEDTFRSLVAGCTDIEWPAVGGVTTGGCAVYVSADRAGSVREAWPAGCDNAGLQDPLRDAVKKWRLKPAISNGVPVQVEALLGFTFHTASESAKGPPLLSDVEARNLATNIVEPDFPPGSAEKGAEIIVQISVDETGKLTGISNTHNLKSPVFFAIHTALQEWRFSPYLKDGKPQYFHADLTFYAP